MAMCCIPRSRYLVCSAAVPEHHCSSRAVAVDRLCVGLDRLRQCRHSALDDICVVHPLRSQLPRKLIQTAVAAGVEGEAATARWRVVDQTSHLLRRTNMS